MKKIFLLSRLFLLPFFATSQNTGGIRSLDDLFVGIPLKEGYPKWVEYISAHPFLGFDSANNRGVYSSMKPGIRTHFPFPDSVLVKLLAERQSVVIGGKTLISYSMKIEGVFGKRNNAKEAAKDCYRKLKKLLRPYYRNFDGTYFRKGHSPAFPDCSLEWGYLSKIDYYIVLLEIYSL